MNLTDEHTHFIKWRNAGEKAWWFLTPNGNGNRKRIHAAQYKATDVEDVLKTLREDNPDQEFKSVRI
jgi:hypothetical protein